MAQVLQQVMSDVKLGREQGYLGQYFDSIGYFQKAIDLIKQNISQVSDPNLLKEWKKLYSTIETEYIVITQLQSIRKGQNVNLQVSPVKQKNQRQYQNECPEFRNENVNTYNAPIIQTVSNLNQVLQHNNSGTNMDAQENNSQHPEKRLPFGQKPFQHLQEKKYAQIKEYQQQMRQTSTYQEPIKQVYNNNNYQKNQPNQQNIFQDFSHGFPPNQMPNGSNYNEIQQAQDYNFLRPNLHENQRDPDVWEPPALQNKKKQSNKQPQQQQQFRPQQQQPQQSQVQQQGLPNNGKGRDYDRPWLKNIKNPQKTPLRKGATGDDQEKSFLYHCYPDGIGPDADLIQRLEKEVLDKNPNVKFEDIADLEIAKDILQEAVLLPILMPQYFTGIRRPWKGVLMFGPPGTGKTMLAKAVATTGKTTFFSVSAAALGTKWRGEAEKLVRLLFEMARFYAPSTIFFDEVDSLGSQRSDNDGDATRKVKSQLLIEMDGVTEANTGEGEDKKIVMVIAATNRPWDLDEALRRRLEKRILIPLPTEKGRDELFKINLNKVPVEEDVDFKELVRRTEGFSGADISNFCREASMMPMRRQWKSQRQGANIDNLDFKNLEKQAQVPISKQDFEDALKNINKSVSKDDLGKFQDWMKEFGSI